MSSKLLVGEEGASWHDEYLVRLKSGVKPHSHCESFPFFKAAAASTAGVNESGTHTLVEYTSACFNGYACKVTSDELEAILKHDDVEAVEPNFIVRAQAIQKDAPWGLQSISSAGPVLPNGEDDVKEAKYTYTYDDEPGAGVDIYVVDSGIQIEHEEFGKRAHWGWEVPGYPKRDDNGHGTHCAGTAAGQRYGVAKSANLIAVKVLNDAGSGSNANVISGIEWIVNNANASRSIISMSLGGPASQFLDDTVRKAIDQGFTFVIAAGNERKLADKSSPARVQDAITVGAVDIKNAQASFSNYGPLVDVWAPGVNILSSWKGRCNGETNVISGTSMATPHVAGLAAYFLSLSLNRKPSNPLGPRQLAATIKAKAKKGLVILRNTADGSPNLLAYNGGQPPAQVFVQLKPKL